MGCVARTWCMAAVIIIPHPEALAYFLLSGPEWTGEGIWPLITYSFPGIKMTLRALQPSPLQRDYSSSPKDCLLPSFLPIFLMKPRRAAPHSHLAAPFPGSTSIYSVPGEEKWPAVAMVTRVPLKSKAFCGSDPKACSGSCAKLYLLCPS